MFACLKSKLGLKLINQSKLKSGSQFHTAFVLVQNEGQTGFKENWKDQNTKKIHFFLIFANSHQTKRPCFSEWNSMIFGRNFDLEFEKFCVDFVPQNNAAFWRSYDLDLGQITFRRDKQRRQAVNINHGTFDLSIWRRRRWFAADLSAGRQPFSHRSSLCGAHFSSCSLRGVDNFTSGKKSLRSFGKEILLPIIANCWLTNCIQQASNR